MTGTSPVAPYVKIDSTTFTFSAYKAAIDGNSVAALRIVAKFAPHAQTSPNMTIALSAGNIFDGTTLTEIAAQNSSTITAPTTHPRIDRVVIDNTTGTLSVVTGTEAVSPTPPAIPTGKSPVAQIALATSTTSITNAMIDDERDFTALNVGGFGVQSAISSASTCDIGTLPSHNAKVTGSTTITALGSSANTQDPVYLIEFSGSLTLTHNATSLILPGAVNIKTAAGDTATAEYLGSGHWRIRDYQRGNGQAVSMAGAEVTLASATTTDLGSTGSNAVLVSGTTAITGFGSGASVANPVYFVRFSGALTLTYDSAAMILPGAADIVTAAGDGLVALYLGSGNWKVLAFYRIDGTPIAGPNIDASKITSGTIDAARLPVVAGQIGSLVFAQKAGSATYHYGDTIDGASLNSTNVAIGTSGVSMPGGTTWQCLGFATGTGGSTPETTLWQRIS